MIYSVNGMSLDIVRDVWAGDTNDVFICRDLNEQIQIYYTLWVIKSHETVKKLLGIYCFNQENEQNDIISFTQSNSFCLLLPYIRERRLPEFYQGSSYDLSTCEAICKSLVMECMACKIPFPVLYLILKQQRINLREDLGISFDYYLDLAELNRSRAEKDCTILCAEILLKILSTQKAERITSYKVISNKVKTGNYRQLIELYKDICLTTVVLDKNSFLRKLKDRLAGGKKAGYRMLWILCLLIALIALITIFSQIIWGNGLLMKLFTNTFTIIGTESLRQ